MIDTPAVHRACAAASANTLRERIALLPPFEETPHGWHPLLVDPGVAAALAANVTASVRHFCSRQRPLRGAAGVDVHFHAFCTLCAVTLAAACLCAAADDVLVDALVAGWEDVCLLQDVHAFAARRAAASTARRRQPLRTAAAAAAARSWYWPSRRRRRAAVVWQRGLRAPREWRRPSGGVVAAAERGCRDGAGGRADAARCRCCAPPAAADADSCDGGRAGDAWRPRCGVGGRLGRSWGGGVVAAVVAVVRSMPSSQEQTDGREQDCHTTNGTRPSLVRAEASNSLQSFG